MKKITFILSVVILIITMMVTGLTANGNLLSNPGFETGFEFWIIEDHSESAVWYVDSCAYQGEYSAFLKASEQGEFWHLQLYQIVFVDSAQTYQFSFYSKAELETNIILNLCQNDSPWVNCGLWDTVWTNTDWSQYEIQFLATKTDTARLSFNLGHYDIGVWIDQVVFDTVTNIDDEQAIPLRFISYPNPFNSEIQISFYVKRASHVKINIYNIIGQKIETLVDERINIGIHEIIWNPKNASSGVYLIKMVSEEKIIVKRITLLE